MKRISPSSTEDGKKIVRANKRFPTEITHTIFWKIVYVQDDIRLDKQRKSKDIRWSLALVNYNSYRHRRISIQCPIARETPLTAKIAYRRMPFAGMLRRGAFVRSNVSEEHIASIIGMTRIGEIGRALALIKI
jgi:hypothetical protein